MNSARAVNHPSDEVLSLFASDDLRYFDRHRVARHVFGCEQCRREMAAIKSSMAQMKREADQLTLTGFEAIADWNRLEREMAANIHVGLVAAQCIDDREAPRLRGWRGLTIATGLTALFVLGWITHIPTDETVELWNKVKASVGAGADVRPNGTVVQTLPDGIAVRAQGATLTILHPTSAVISLNGQSSVGARYVDEETGQVTITNVYGQ